MKAKIMKRCLARSANQTQGAIPNSKIYYNKYRKNLQDIYEMSCTANFSVRQEKDFDVIYGTAITKKTPQKLRKAYFN